MCVCPHRGLRISMDLRVSKNALTVLTLIADVAVECHSLFLPEPALLFLSNLAVSLLSKSNQALFPSNSK